jgi:membrane fusion protein (multidrug efflux system)
MTEAPQPPPLPAPGRRRFIGFLVVGLLLVPVIVGRTMYLNYTRIHISTDDAYVEGTIFSVAPRVPGTVVKVTAELNQRVRAGDVLVEIDPDVARQRVREAETARETEAARGGELAAQQAGARSRIAAAEANLARVLAQRGELEAAVGAREADVRSRRVQLEQARINLVRAENLLAKKVAPRDRYEEATTAFYAVQATLESALELKKQAEVTLANHAAVVAQAKAGVEVEKTALTQVAASIRVHGEQVKGRDVQVELARLNLGYTTLTAPADGVVTKKAVEVGNQVQAGQPLLAVVSMRDPTVVANYKETQVHAIKPGMKVRLRVDALPGRELAGKVDSIMAGTGAAFSLFPPENASGNYVKVVQRIPVRIRIDPGQGAEELLRVGMSVEPTVLADE